MVGSVHLTSALLVQRSTRLMAETLPPRKTCYFCFSFVWLPSHACGNYGLQEIQRLKTSQQELFDQNTWTGDEESLPWQCIVWGVFSSGWCITDVDGQEDTGSFVMAIVFSLCQFFQPVCFVSLCICVDHEKDVVCLSKYVQEISFTPSSCWWNTNAYTKT